MECRLVMIHSAPMMIEETSVLLLTVFSIGFYDQPDKINSTGVFNLGYNYNISKRITIDVDYGWEKNTKIWYGTRPEDYESFSISVNSITGGLKYHYIVIPNFALYSRLLFEVSIPSNTKETEHHFQTFRTAFQITPIGVYYGNKLQVFNEFGFGYRGLLNFGINLKF